MKDKNYSDVAPSADELGDDLPRRNPNNVKATKYKDTKPVPTLGKNRIGVSKRKLADALRKGSFK